MVKKIIYKIRVVYNSGYTHDFEVYSFTIQGDKYEWEVVDKDNKPLLLNPTAVESVWQVGHRIEVSA